MTKHRKPDIITNPKKDELDSSMDNYEVHNE
jgi:hypothetical protein